MEKDEGVAGGVSFLEEIKSKQEALHAANPFLHGELEQQNQKKVSVEDALLAIVGALKKNKVTQFLPLVTLDTSSEPSVTSVLQEVVKVLQDAQVTLSVEVRSERVVGKVL